MSKDKQYYLNKYILGEMTVGDWWDMAQETCPAIASAVESSKLIKCVMREKGDIKQIACLGARHGTIRFLYEHGGRAFAITCKLSQKAKFESNFIIMENNFGKTMQVSFPDIPELL
jgi:hypothetical protein